MSKLAIMFNYKADRFAVATFDGQTLDEQTWGYSADGAAKTCLEHFKPAIAQVSAVELGAGRVVYIYSEKLEDKK